MTQPSKEDRELARQLFEQASKDVGSDIVVLATLERFLQLVRSHFSPTPPIDHAFKELEQELRDFQDMLGRPPEFPGAITLPDKAANAIRQQADENAQITLKHQVACDTIQRQRADNEAISSCLKAIKDSSDRIIARKDKTIAILQSQIDAIKGQAVVAKKIIWEGRPEVQWFAEVPEGTDLIVRPTFPPTESETKGEGA